MRLSRATLSVTLEGVYLEENAKLAKTFSLKLTASSSNLFIYQAHKKRTQVTQIEKSQFNFKFNK